MAGQAVSILCNVQIEVNESVINERTSEDGAKDFGKP